MRYDRKTAMASVNAPKPGSSGLNGAIARFALQAEGTLAAGSLVGQYVIEKAIGSGGYGIVYAARHHAFKQRVAVKVLRAELTFSPVLVTRFMREAQAVNRIGHPNIVTIHEFGESPPGRPYYVMELLDGVDLMEFLGLHARFSPTEALELLGPVCEALAAAHAHGIIHRDIKASNVMVAERDGQRVIKLLDFGIAKILTPEATDPGLTEPGVRLGTSGNMAPEQIRGERIDERADIYAVGVLLYQLLTGEPPFHGVYPQQIALLHLQTPAPRPSLLAAVSADVDAVVLRCLEKLPGQRYQNVTALLEAFRHAVGGQQDPPQRTSLAVAFYCQATIVEDGEEDDAVLDDLLAVLELAQQALGDHGFVFPMVTSNALLAVRVLSENSSADAGRTVGRAVGDVLSRELAERPTAHPALCAELSMTVGLAQYQVMADGKIEIVGGPLFDLDAWTADNRL